MKFRKTLEDLEEISRQLKAKGIIVENLDGAIADLKVHQSNIEKIEENIDAIKQEVIAPIKKELGQNKIAGKFSIFGFWVGSIGLIASIYTVFFQPSSILQKIESIERHLVISKETTKEIPTKEGDIFVRDGNLQEVAFDDNNKISIKPNVYSYPSDEGLKVGVRVYKGANQVGMPALKQMFVRSDGKSGLRPSLDNDEIALAVGDSISTGKTQVEVIRIFSEKPYGRAMGDDKTGVLVRVKKGVGG